MLKEIYDKNRWGNPNYIVLRRKQGRNTNWVIGIECPPTLNCKNTVTYGRFKKRLLGFAKNYLKKTAEEKAADEAIKTLERL